jgi:hypothetical protein
MPKTAYTAAQAYFVDNPTGTPTAANLESYGLTTSTGVTVTTSGDATMLLQWWVPTASGDKTYTVAEGGVTNN